MDQFMGITSLNRSTRGEFKLAHGLINLYSLLFILCLIHLAIQGLSNLKKNYFIFLSVYLYWIKLDIF